MVVVVLPLFDVCVDFEDPSETRPLLPYVAADSGLQELRAVEVGEMLTKMDSRWDLGFPRILAAYGTYSRTAAGMRRARSTLQHFRYVFDTRGWIQVEP